MKQNLFVLLGIIVTLLGGSTLAPKYTKPEGPVPPSWPIGPPYKDAQATAGAPDDTANGLEGLWRAGDILNASGARFRTFLIEA